MLTYFKPLPLLLCANYQFYCGSLNQMSVNTDWKIVVVYVVGKEVLDVSLYNSLDIVNALYVGLILSGIPHTVVITEQ